MNNKLIINFELTPENLKELKQIPKRTDEEQIKEYKRDLKKYVENIENINDIKILSKLKQPNLKNYKYDYDKAINDLITKNILITKKELKKILDII
jgi:hypothetical protein